MFERGVPSATRRTGPAGRASARAAAILCLLVLSGGCGRTAAIAAQQAPHLWSSFDLQVPAPPIPVSVADTVRLVYEVHLTSFGRDPLLLERIDVLDGEAGEPLASLGGEELGRRIGPDPTVPGAAPRTIAPTEHAVAYVEIALPDGRVPDGLRHRVTYRAIDDEASATGEVEGARVHVPSGSPVVLGPPLRGGPWAAIYHTSWAFGHRRFVYAVGGRARIPGRFAVDWIRLGPGDRVAPGDENVVADWYGYGAPVLAVADAVVAAVRDDVPESATLEGHPRLPLEDGAGNYVVLDLGDGRYAFYEHLRSGSTSVAAGDQVRQGDVIAEVGFTGHTVFPHLHFHVADAISSLDAEGLPFELEAFDVLGGYDFGAFGELPERGPPDLSTFRETRWHRLSRPVRRSRGFPAPNVVVEFAAGRTPDGSSADHDR